MPPLSADDECVQVTLALLEQFASDANADNQQFALLHVPPRPLVELYLDDEGFSYQFMIDDLEEDIPFIHAEAIFTSIDEDDWASSEHYTRQTHQRQAEYTTDWLIDYLGLEGCD